jgi:hypothetical protein
MHKGMYSIYIFFNIFLPHCIIGIVQNIIIIIGYSRNILPFHQDIVLMQNKTSIFFNFSSCSVEGFIFAVCDSWPYRASGADCLLLLSHCFFFIASFSLLLSHCFFLIASFSLLLSHCLGTFYAKYCLYCDFSEFL